MVHIVLQREYSLETAFPRLLVFEVADELYVFRTQNIVLAQDPEVLQVYFIVCNALLFLRRFLVWTALLGQLELRLRVPQQAQFVRPFLILN